MEQNRSQSDYAEPETEAPIEHYRPESGLAALVERVGPPRPLILGFIGLLFFMVGDGVESGFITPYLAQNGAGDEQRAAIIVTVYGIFVTLGSFLSGALSETWGPRRVMWLGLAIWAVFEVLFLAVALTTQNYVLMLIIYGIRGIAYPLFAYSFLLWVLAASPARKLGSAVGWFYFCFTGGLPTLGSLLASGTEPIIGQYATLWLSLVIVVIGGVLALIGLRGAAGGDRLAAPSVTTRQSIIKSLSIAVENPRIGAGCIIRIINTAPLYAFLVFLPTVFADELGFGTAGWLQLVFLIGVANVFANLFFGIISDIVGWHRSLRIFGCLGCAVSSPLLYFLPQAYPQYWVAALCAMFYGVTLAAFTPISVLMSLIAPENKGNAIAVLNLGAGASTLVGPLIVALFLGVVGAGGVSIIFSALYVVAASLVRFLKIPAESQEVLDEDAALIDLDPETHRLRRSVSLRFAPEQDEIDLVLFDIGGTIYDDDRYAQALHRAIQELADDPVEEDEFWEFYDSQSEHGGKALRAAFARRYLTNESADRLVEETRRHWEYPPEALYRDVVPTLTALSGRYKLGLLSDSPEQVRDALRRDGIHDMVDFVLLGGIDGPEKPDPRLFQLALERAGVTAPSKAVYVGNRLDTDVRGAQRTGLHSIWMLRGETSPAPTMTQLREPDAVITSLVGLPIAMARLAGQRAEMAS